MARILAILVLLFLCRSEATEPDAIDVTMALIPLPGVLEPGNQNAPYNRLVAYISEQGHYRLTFEHLPFNRAEQLMINKQVDCIFPVVRGSMQWGFPILQSSTINQVSVHLFSLTQVYKSFDDIEGDAVIHLEAFEFGYWALEGKDKVTTIPVRSQSAAMKVLRSERAKAYIDYYPDVRLSFPPEDYSQLKFSINDPLQIFEDIFECNLSPQNTVFIDWLNGMLERDKATGDHKQLLGEYYNFN